MYKNSRLFSIVSYITWIGWIIALLAREKDDSLVRRHLNQALVLNIIETLASLLGRANGILGVIGTVIELACLVLFIMGIVRAVKMNEEPLPLVGGIELIK